METPMNSFSFSVISTVSDLFSSFENYTSSSTWNIQMQRWMNNKTCIFISSLIYAFRYLKVVHDVSLRWQIFCSSTLDSFATTVSSNVNDFVLSPNDVFCPVPASQSQDSNDTVKINCFIIMFLNISCPDIWNVRARRSPILAVLI